MIIKEFICPECFGDLLKDANSYICRNCSSNWKIKDKIPVFLKDNSVYWGEISEEETSKLNALAEISGWRSAIKSFLSDEVQQSICNTRRTNWKYFIESNTPGRILDIGSGWGTLSFSLAKDCELVYAFESVWQRVKFIQIRKIQEEVENLIPVCGNALKLPFPDDYFDVAILNGVLEWLGLSDVNLRPSEAQEKALRDVFRVLKPGGSLYVGIENRFAYFYFFGRKDPHSDLRFVTLMPRFIANLYSRLVKKEDYRTYTYSLGGYRKLLRKTGFMKVSFYTPVGGYQNFKYILGLNSPKIIKYWLLELIYPKLLFSPKVFRIVLSFLRILFILPLKRVIKYFIPDFSIIAVKEIPK